MHSESAAAKFWFTIYTPLCIMNNKITNWILNPQRNIITFFTAEKFCLNMYIFSL